MTLQEYLDLKEMSIRAFAALSGVSQATISRIARGNTASLAAAKRIEAATKRRVRIKDLPE